MEITALLYWEIEFIHKRIDVNPTNNHSSKALWLWYSEAETKLKPPRAAETESMRVQEG